MAEVCGSIGRRVAGGFLCGFGYGTIGDTTTELTSAPGVAAMKPRTIRRLVVAGLAAAAVAVGIFGSMATSSAQEFDWNAPASQVVVR
jgi:hypothetical protein